MKTKVDVLIEISRERTRQDGIWGVQNHDAMAWHLILAEEFGEVSRAVNEHHFRNAPYDRVREELIQTAAVCVAMIQSLDRGGHV